MTKHHSDVSLDLSGLLCPLPVLKTRKRMASMKDGEILHVIATDPMVAIDMPHFCNEQGLELLVQEKYGGTIMFWIRITPSHKAQNQPLQNHLHIQSTDDE